MSIIMIPNTQSTYFVKQLVFMHVLSNKLNFICVELCVRISFFVFSSLDFSSHRVTASLFYLIFYLAEKMKKKINVFRDCLIVGGKNFMKNRSCEEREKCVNIFKHIQMK